MVVWRFAQVVPNTYSVSNGPTLGSTCGDWWLVRVWYGMERKFLILYSLVVFLLVPFITSLISLLPLIRFPIISHENGNGIEGVNYKNNKYPEISRLGSRDWGKRSSSPFSVDVVQRKKMYGNTRKKSLTCNGRKPLLCGEGQETRRGLKVVRQPFQCRRQPNKKIIGCSWCGIAVRWEKKSGDFHFGARCVVHLLLAIPHR